MYFEKVFKMTATKLIVGNWKMNGLVSDSTERTQKLVESFKNTEAATMVLCPPATMIGLVSAMTKNSAIAFGGQDCHTDKSGAFTGDISAEMLKNLGCSYVILGHSERRQKHGESSPLVAAKAKAAHAAGLRAIICVGETDAERSAKEAENVVKNQLRHSLPASATPQNTIVAYEPLWAIGTGKTASLDEITKMHKLIRSLIGTMPILYGGSVKPDKAGEILELPNVDGVLVGGASLKAEEFLSIAGAAK